MNLRTDDGLRTAYAQIAVADRSDWIAAISETIRRVRAADEETRATLEFQRFLWEDNHMAAIGQGNIAIEHALGDAEFRRWFARKSIEQLPPTFEEKVEFLDGLYEELRTRLTRKSVPHLKIFRVLAALYPDALTTVGSRHKIKQLANAMGQSRGDSIFRQLWVRRRIDEVLGPVSDSVEALADRLSLPWVLFERFVEGASQPEGTLEEPLQPLPAALRRRGLTAIGGLFTTVLAALEFVKDGVSRHEFIDYLHASSPDLKPASLGLVINVIESELGAIKRDQKRYFLTKSGRQVLETQDPIHFADWILCRVLGPDKAIATLRDHERLPNGELLAIVRSMNPNWSTDFVAQSILSWLRSMDVIESDGGNYTLTEAGQQWAARIAWVPEALPTEPSVSAPPADVILPPFAEIYGPIVATGVFPEHLVAKLHAGIWSHKRRHFAILAGLSGSGKTMLAQAYAKALAGHSAERRLFTLPVQPGWYDPSALLGYVNPLREGAYVRTKFLSFLIDAGGDPQNPYVAILDEMNLSHPEQYMAPLLSAMETGDPVHFHAEGDVVDGIPSSIPYPNNLVLIGTVNMDETTHGLSDKVLDRAFVFEFWDVDLDAYPKWTGRNIGNTELERTRQLLTELNGSLAPARLHFGWRVVDDVLDFLERACEGNPSLPFEVALDSVIYAKVLPKLRGEDSPRFREALGACSQRLDAVGLKTCVAKIASLKQDLDTMGSARFWR